MSFTQSKSIKGILTSALLDVKEKRRKMDLYQVKLDSEKAIADHTIKGLEDLMSNCEKLAHKSSLPAKALEPIGAKVKPSPSRSEDTVIQVDLSKPFHGERPVRLENGKYEPGKLTLAVVWEVRHSAGLRLTRDGIAQLVGVNGRGLTNALNKAVGSRMIKVNPDGLYYW